ncbi:MAG: hypothetical protein AABX33_06410 [Nanoarchaeota archaeon]
MAPDVVRNNLFLLVYPVIALLVSFYFKVEYLTLIWIFFGVPSLVLSYFNMHLVKKVAFFSIIFSLPFTTIIDYMAVITGSWTVTTSFPFRLFDIIAIEDFVWGFLYLYFVIMYYEYFLENKHKDRLYYPNMKYLAIAFAVFLIAFLASMFMNPMLLNIPYFYFIFGIVIEVIPIGIIVFKHPPISSGLLKISAYFFYLLFLMGIAGVKLGHYSYPGANFIGWINLFFISVPIEELIFAFILSSPATIAYYKLFDEPAIPDQ